MLVTSIYEASTTLEFLMDGVRVVTLISTFLLVELTVGALRDLTRS